MLTSLTQNTRIYVAGHTGLIGSAFVRLLTENHHQHVITRTHKELDLTNQQAVNDFFNLYQPEIVILAAGKVGGIIENQNYPADFITTNLAIQLNVLQAAFKTNAQKIIFFGSSCMYPRECSQPMSETVLLTGKPEITSLPYGLAKLAGVYTCLGYNQQLKETRFLPVIPNTAYGPFDNFNPDAGHVLPALIKRFHQAKKENLNTVELWGSGNPKREFIYADDIAAACYYLLQLDLSKIQFPLNIGTGIDHSIQELAGLISTTVGYQGSVVWNTNKPDGAPRKLLDSSQLFRLGWQPTVPLKRGIRQTYEWFLENYSKE